MFTPKSEITITESEIARIDNACREMQNEIKSESATDGTQKRQKLEQDPANQIQVVPENVLQENAPDETTPLLDLCRLTQDLNLEKDSDGDSNINME